jgi:hypothetical protein
MVSSLPAHMSAQILPNLVQKTSDLELLKVHGRRRYIAPQYCFGFACTCVHQKCFSMCSDASVQHLMPLLDGQHHIDDIIWTACVSRETLEKLIAEHKEFLVKTLRL